MGSQAPKEDGPTRLTPRAVFQAALRLAGTLTLLFVAYAFAPGTEKTTWGTALTFSLILGALIVLLVFDIRSVMKSAHPGLRAVQVLVTTLAVFLVAVSLTYLGMSHVNKGAFSQPLDHITAFYFTVVVFSTVGFGDIYGKTDPARLAVTIQIFLDLLFIATVVQLLVGTVQRRLSAK
jgi:voltage-gated potassium channel